MPTILLICISSVVISSSALAKYSVDKSYTPSKILFPQPEETKITEKATAETNFNQPLFEPHGAAPRIYTECGGVIDGSGIIQYKYNQTYNNLELCIWTVRNNQSGFLNFQYRGGGLEPLYDFIQINTFQKDHNNQPSESYILGPGQVEIHLNAPVAFIIFATDSSTVGTGFQLYIIGKGSCYPTCTEIYKDFNSGLTSGSLNLQPYFNNMMSSFVVSPKSVRTVSINYHTESGYDNISVFKLERAYTNNRYIMSYGFTERYSGIGDARHFLTASPYPTAIIYIFTSDGSILGNGVNVLWF